MIDLELLKSNLNIIRVAEELGFYGVRHGTYSQGNCPRHTSTGGTCLNIWENSQRFHCFHCRASGDVIELVRLYQNCDFMSAADYLIEKSGLKKSEFLSEPDPVKRKQIESEMEEKSLVETMLTKAAGWYHERLTDYPDVHRHLLEHYKISQEIIDDLQIGFAPISTRPDGQSELAEYLQNSSPDFRGKLSLCGLFSFKQPEGPYYDFFKGRIIFPTWNYGKVVGMAARSIDYTPQSYGTQHNPTSEETIYAGEQDQ